MLDLSKCTIVESVPVEVLSTIGTVEEGMAAIHVLENGRGKVRPSTGASGEIFRGVFLGNPTVSTSGRRVESLTVPAASPFTLTLAKTPVGDPSVVVEAAGANARVVLAKAASASTTEYAISGSVVTVHSSFAGRKLTVTYEYSLTVAEAQLLPGINTLARNDLGVAAAMGLITTGEIFTTNYAPEVDWASFSSSNQIKLAANGRFTLGGSGGTIANAVVTKVPGVNDTTLGLYLNAA